MTKPSAHRQPTLAELAGKTPSPASAAPAALCSDPYWRQGQSLTAATHAQLPRKVDVVVIGSGFTGLSAALTLTRAGRSVAILEKDQLGAGASTRNGSQLGSGNQKFRVKTLIEMFGELKAKALLSEGVAMLDYIPAPRPATKRAAPISRPRRYSILSKGHWPRGAHASRTWCALWSICVTSTMPKKWPAPIARCSAISGPPARWSRSSR